MMKKKLLALSLATFMVVQYIPLQAEEITPSEKEEVVYIMLDSSGSVKSVNTVNIFEKGDVVDYGDYTEVKNLTGSENIEVNGDEITYTANEKSYYQGTNKNTQTPWNIDIDYYLDGKKYTASQIAGKSGNLEIQMHISKNESFEGDFYDNYALQASLTLDTNKCENIQADGATVANVGEDKQISYTILPGKGLSTSITADVTNFEMSAIEINGVQLNLNVDIDDAELMDKVTQLMDATKQLNDGSQQLKSNSSSLENGSSSLNDGLRDLHSGVSSLDAGVASLQEGMQQAQSALATLDSNSASLQTGSNDVKTALDQINTQLEQVSITTDELTTLTSSSSQIKTAITNLANGVSYASYKAAVKEGSNNQVDVDTVLSSNAITIETLSGQISILQNQLNSAIDENTKSQLQAQITQLQGIVTLLQGNTAVISGVQTYLDGNESIIGVKGNLQKLSTSYEAFDTGITTLVTKLSSLTTQMNTLKAAINQLDTKYAQLNTGVQSYTSGVSQLNEGYKTMMSGISALASGSQQLLDGSNSASQGANDLYAGIVKYCDGVDELSTGTEKLYTETDGMDETIQEKIDEILDSISGGNTEVVSFVSSKNTNVDAVQFVIKTDAIEKEEVKEVEKTTEEPTILDKIKGLFE